MTVFTGKELSSRLDGAQGLQPLVGETGPLEGVMAEMRIVSKGLDSVLPASDSVSWSSLLGGAGPS